jgi:phosphate transport system protein
VNPRRVESVDLAKRVADRYGSYMESDGLSRSGAIWPVAMQIDRLVIQMFARVSDLIAGATLALLTGDRDAGRSLVKSDAEIDALFEEIDQLALQHLHGGTDAPARLRYLVTVLRMLPELERSGDLAAHIARRATRGLSTEMSARARGLVEQMGEVGSRMWEMAADAYGDRTPDIAERLDEFDDEMDELHVTLTAELGTGSMELPVIVELTLVARFYERLGDHAVNIVRRVPARPLLALQSVEGL